MWQFNARHNGVYGDNDLVGINNSSYKIPNEFSLKQNYPNPFNSTTNINYELPIANFIILKIYNIVGKEVATLVNEKQDPGRYSVQFYGSSLPSGIYFYRIKAGNFSKTMKMLQIK